MNNSTLEHNLLAGKLITLSRYVNNAIYEILVDHQYKDPMSNKDISNKVFILSDALHNLEGLGGAIAFSSGDQISYMSTLIKETLLSNRDDIRSVVPLHKFPTKYADQIFSEYIELYKKPLPATYYENALGTLIYGIGLGFTRIRYNTLYNGSMLTDPKSSARALAACQALGCVLELGNAIEQGSEMAIYMHADSVLKECQKTFPIYENISVDKMYLDVILSALSKLLSVQPSINIPSSISE